MISQSNNLNVNELRYYNNLWNLCSASCPCIKRSRASQVLLVVKSPPTSAVRLKKCGFDPWVGKIPWRRVWQPTAVFLPRECHGHRNLAGCSPQGHTELHMTETTQHICSLETSSHNQERTYQHRLLEYLCFHNTHRHTCNIKIPISICHRASALAEIVRLCQDFSVFILTGHIIKTFCKTLPDIRKNTESDEFAVKWNLGVV